MIEKTGGNSALFTALNGMNRAMQNLDQKASRVAAGNPDADKMVALKVAQQNVKMQAENIRTAMEAGEQILNILV